MLTYWIIIALIFLLFVVFRKYRKEQSKGLCIIYFFILTFISGCRASTVGTDTHAYLNLFLINNGYLSGYANQEILFKYLCKIIGYFTADPQWLLIVCAAITTFGVIFFSYFNSKNIALSVFLYITLYFYFFSMNGVRQFVAIGILLVASEFARRRKIISFVFLIVIAVGFHNTSVFGIVIWWIYNPNLKKRNICLIFACLISGILSFDRLVPLIASIFPRYQVYLENSASFSSGGIMAAVIFTIISIAGIGAAIDKNWLNDSHNRALFFLVVIAAIFSIGSFSIGILRRVCWMFEIYAIVLVPNLMSSRFYHRSRYYLYVTIVVMGLLYLLYCFSFNWNAVLPYRFCF